jgi:AbrB family looped-hinge helix DNA binding protein
MNLSQEACFADAFYGSATVGERGQIVIPAEARADMGFAPGDKVLIMRHPYHKGLMVFKIDAVREFIDEFTQSIDRLEADTEGAV